MKVFWIIISNKQLKEALHCWIKVFIKGVYCDYLKMENDINYQFILIFIEKKPSGKILLFTL